MAIAVVIMMRLFDIAYERAVFFCCSVVVVNGAPGSKSSAVEKHAKYLWWRMKRDATGF